MSNLKYVFLSAAIICIFCGAHYYLARCLCLCIQPFIPKFRIVYALIILILLSAAMVLSVARPFSGIPQRIISVIGTVWMGLIVYLLLFSAAADLASLIAKLFPQAPQKLRLALHLCAFFLAIITVVLGFLHANRIRTVNYSVSLSENPKSQMKLVLISDIHLGAVNSEARLKKTVEAVNKQNPDLICIAGDIFDNNYSAIINPEEVANTLKQFSSTYGVYACLGNHDSGAELDKMLSLLDNSGINLLRDEYAVIDGRLVFVGRNDPFPIGGSKNRQDLSEIIPKTAFGLPSVVLDHNPGNLNEYCEKNVLILSGHTHKGQIFPGSLITNALFEVDHGYLKTENGTQMIVTSGAGTWGLPIRVGTDCEIAAINLSY